MRGEPSGGVVQLQLKGEQDSGVRLIEVGLLVSCFRHFSEQYNMAVFGTMICFSHCVLQGGIIKSEQIFSANEYWRSGVQREPTRTAKTWPLYCLPHFQSLFLLEVGCLFYYQPGQGLMI